MRWMDPRRPWAQRYGSLVVWIPLLCLLSMPLWLWWMRPAQTIQAVIIDRTVEKGNTREHDSLLWVLRHHKVQVHWQGPEERLQIPAGTQWIFATDTYGVYLEDPNQRRQKRKYGGWRDQEIGLLEDYCAAGGNLYAEFNTLAYPTVGMQRARLEKLLGLKFSGWTGRYFDDLKSTEVPAWLQARVDPAATCGYVLLHEDGRTLTLAGPPQQFGLGPAPYNYWFDIVSAAPGVEVLASYEFDAANAPVLKRNGIPLRFPALISHTEKGRRVYACGDFSDNPCRRGPYWVAGVPALNRWRFGNSPSQAPRFYWTFYVPFIETLLGRE